MILYTCTALLQPCYRWHTCGPRPPTCQPLAHLATAMLQPCSPTMPVPALSVVALPPPPPPASAPAAFQRTSDRVANKVATGHTSSIALVLSSLLHSQDIHHLLQPSHPSTTCYSQVIHPPPATAKSNTTFVHAPPPHTSSNTQLLTPSHHHSYYSYSQLPPPLPHCLCSPSRIALGHMPPPVLLLLLLPPPSAWPPRRPPRPPCPRCLGRPVALVPELAEVARVAVLAQLGPALFATPALTTLASAVAAAASPLLLGLVQVEGRLRVGAGLGLTDGGERLSGTTHDMTHEYMT